MRKVRQSWNLMLREQKRGAKAIVVDYQAWDVTPC